MTDRHANGRLETGEDGEFVDHNVALLLASKQVQRLINSAVTRYEERVLRRLAEGVMQGTIDAFLKITAREVTKGRFIPIHEAV